MKLTLKKKIKEAPKKTTEKFCKDCKWCYDEEVGGPWCKSPRRLKENVSGKTFPYKCLDARACDLLCDRGMKWFEPKDYFGTTITYFSPSTQTSGGK